MYKWDYALFLGKEEERYHTEFVVDDNFFFIIEVENSLSKEKLHLIVEALKNNIKEKKPSRLDEFSSILDKAFVDPDLTESASLACGLLIDKVFYIKTKGRGSIHLKRGDKFKKIIEGNVNASGPVETGDHFIFSSAAFTGSIATLRLWEKIDDRSPHEVVDEITPLLKEHDDFGMFALFIKFSPRDIEEISLEAEPVSHEVESPKMENSPNRFQQGIMILKNNLNNLQLVNSRQRRITFLAALLLFIVLAWSIVFGAQRRAKNAILKQVADQSKSINQKIVNVDDVAILNIEQSFVLLQEARKDLASLKELAGPESKEAIQELSQKITEKEKKLLRKETKNNEEFYDLDLIEDGATGNKLYKDGQSLIILNNNDGKIYRLSLAKKSSETFKSTDVKGASLITHYNDTPFFLNPEKGIYKFSQLNKAESVIEKDEDWGILTDIWIYNGNIYLLDTGKDEIYKYLVAASGYSGKNSYIKSGQAISIDDRATMAIDSSVYILSGNKLYKFVSGVRENIALNIPRQSLDNPTYTKIYTDQDTSKLYILNQKNSVIYVLNKDGVYEKQISSSIFNKAADFIVSDEEKAIFILDRSKIYKVGI